MLDFLDDPTTGAATRRAAELINHRRRELATAQASDAAGYSAALRAQHRLAHAYRAARRFDDALRWFRAAAADSAELYGADDWRTLRYRSSLANCYYAAGDLERAAAMFASLLDIRQATLGPQHPDTQRSRGSLANALDAVGRCDAAVAVRAGGDLPVDYAEISGDTIHHDPIPGE